MYHIPERDYRRLQDRAYRAQQKDHIEVCGIAFVNSKGKIRLVFTKNSSKTSLSFKINDRSMKEAREQIRKGEKIFSTFHSHPLGEATPSSGDKKSAFYFRKAIIYDVCGRQVRLWKKNKRKFKELPIKVKWLP